MLLQVLVEQGRINPPNWLADNLQYLTVVGSEAFGVTSDASDTDLYGFVIPPKHLVFPHLAGEIAGFGRQHARFDVWQQHHVMQGTKQYDFSIYGIVRYFHLCMENNPNMIDTLFTPRRCVLHSTAIGEHVRDQRRLFLHKGAWHKYKGYAYAQMSKIACKTHTTNPQRAASIAQYGYDVKYAYHVVRLLAQVEQIMTEGDLDLERNREQLKAIRRGEWSIDQLHSHFTDKERTLEMTYLNSSLPHAPDEQRIKTLLLECLEMHYGNLAAAIVRNPSMERLLDELQQLLVRYSASVGGNKSSQFGLANPA